MSEYSGAFASALRDDYWYTTSTYDSDHAEKAELGDVEGTKPILLGELLVERQQQHKCMHMAVVMPLHVGNHQLRGRDDGDADDPESVDTVFCEEVERWKVETAGVSSITEIVANPHYLRIIGLGKDALPLIFKELKESGGHWFAALVAITGANPVPRDSAGRTKLMAAAWLSWGNDRRYC